jgi:hypothetical protein
MLHDAPYIVKGLRHEMKFFQAYNNKWLSVLSVLALVDFTNFCFLVDEKIKLKFLTCALKLITRTNFEIPSSRQ